MHLQQFQFRDGCRPLSGAWPDFDVDGLIMLKNILRKIETAILIVTGIVMLTFFLVVLSKFWHNGWT